MPDPLESAHLKLRRARDHIRALNECVRRFHKTDPYRVIRELEREGAEHVYRVEVFREPPPYLGTVIGDALHNLRSALDSIAYDLSGPHMPALSDREIRSIGFPIAVEAAKFDSKPIRFVPQPARAEIERAQPCHREMPGLEPLALIQRFNNLDKHRFVVVAPSLSIGSIWKNPEGVAAPVERFHPLGAFVDGAELARFTFAEPHPEIAMEFTPMFDIAIGDRPLPAGIDLTDMLRHVRDDVLPRFNAFV